MAENKSNCESVLEDLTPVDNIKNNGIYTCSLKTGINKKNIKNIALSGAYGSGKSSILKTFEKEYSNDYEFLNISLADFEGSNKNNDSIDVERSILQKMFYSVKSEQIPFSRFKRIKDISTQELKDYSLYGFIWIVFFFIAYKHKDLPEYLSFIKYDFFYILSITITFIGIFSFLPLVISLFGNIDLKKVNLKNGDVDLGQKDDSSILNKNLDEIIYFFKATNYNVVIFEDLDRYTSNIDIFTKLREINLILNNSNEIEQNITFIYAIKDNNFKDENRTKFFDLIIPVIPVVDYSNSSEQLKKMLKKHKETTNLKKQLLNKIYVNEICLYINNMRLLKNIFNEFIIYKEKLNGENLKNEKLFSLIVYKNLFPNDFSMLCNRDGLVYKIINKKSEIINIRISELDSELVKLNKKVLDVKEELVESVNELRSIYIFSIIKKVGSNSNKLRIGSQYFSLENLLTDKDFDKLKKSTDIRGELNYHNSLTFTSFEKELNTKSYSERETNIINKNHEYQDDLKKKIENLESEKQKLKSLQLKDLIRNKDFTFSDEFEDKGLLIFLISNGYIDESYNYYISHFYEESITKEDRDFILSIRERRPLDYQFKLNNISEVIKQISFDEFKREEILNFDLFEYLLENRKFQNKRIDYILKQLDNDKNLDFIDGYIDLNRKNVDVFIDIMTKASSWLWREIEDSNFTKEKKEKYLKLIFKHTHLENISRLDIEKFVLEIDNFSLFIQGIELERIEKILDSLSIYFSRPKQVMDNEKLFEFVYRKGYFEYSFEMIELILNKFNKSEFNRKELKIKNLTIIRNSTCEELIEDIEKNLGVYVEEILLACDELEEDEDVIISILNSNIDNSNMEKIIQKQKNKIENIQNIDSKELWTKLFENNKIYPIWNNVIHYFEYSKKIDKCLIDYFNILDNATELSKVKINTKTNFIKENIDIDINIAQKLLKEMLLIDEINIGSYKKLVKSNGYWYDSLDISKISEEKIISLVENNMFTFIVDNFNKLKEYTQNGHIKLIEYHEDKFLTEFENFEVNTSDIIELLNSNKLSKKTKKEIILKIDYEYISNNKIAELVFSIDDRKRKKEYNYIYKMIKSLDSLEKRITIINEQEEYLGRADFLELLYLLPDEYKKIAKQDGKQSLLTNMQYNKSLIKILKDRSFITSAKEDKKNKRKIRLWVKNQ